MQGFNEMSVDRRYHHPKTVELVSAGVSLSMIQPGGRRGPNGEVLWPTPGGQVWYDSWVLGSADQAFQLAIPDIRMPANQYWPLHWHDCWIAVLVLDGTCLFGDWWMQPGDILISPPGIEYGPLVNGPEGCQMFEIFARQHLNRGGYASEYHDHPTLQGMSFAFLPRSARNARNNGNQTLPLDGNSGLTRSRLEPGGVWNLGEPDDPDTGVFTDVRLAAGERLAAHSYRDWHALFVMEGAITLQGRRLEKGAVLVIEPDALLAPMDALTSEVRLLRVARTAAADDEAFSRLAQVRSNGC